MITKKEFTKEFAEKAGITLVAAKKNLAVFQDLLYTHIMDEGGVKVCDGVVLTAVEKPARSARNPRTGEVIDVPAKIHPKCKFGRSIKQLLNSN